MKSLLSLGCIDLPLPARSVTLGPGRERTPTLICELGVFSTGWLGLQGPRAKTFQAL